MLHLEEIIRGALNMFTDVVAVRGTPYQSAKDEHVQRAKKEICSRLRLFCHSRRSTLNFDAIVGRLLSLVKYGMAKSFPNWRPQGNTLTKRPLGYM